jgi:hypothetical protein
MVRRAWNVLEAPLMGWTSHDGIGGGVVRHLWEASAVHTIRLAHALQVARGLVAGASDAFLGGHPVRDLESA